MTGIRYYSAKTTEGGHFGPLPCPYTMETLTISNYNSFFLRQSIMSTVMESRS